nr:PREDICTED: restin homolog [Daucus carota subsp. sativus]
MADQFQGKSDFRAPLLTGSDNYNWWKGQMEAHISRDPLMQRVVERGPYQFLDKDGKVKDVDELTTDELTKMGANGKARSTLISGLNQAEYDKELGAFSFQKGETIKEAQARFQLIVNNLGRLGKIIPQSELNMNILASVPFDFQSKVTALEAAHNIDTMDHLALFAELEQFERKMHSKKHDAPVEKMKNLALTAEKSKPESDEESDEDLALLSKKIQRMINKHNQLKREKGKDKAKYSSSRKPSKESKDQNCFECGKPGHFKKDCYKLKSKQPAVSKDKKKKSKALLTWSDDEEESASNDESGEELINLALVGMEDDNVQGLTDDGLVETDSEDDNSEEQDHIPNEEYNSLKAENSKLIEKNNYLKNMVQELMQKIDKFFDSKEPTQARIKELQEKLDQAEGFHKVLMRRNEVQKEEISQLKQEVEARDACLETFKLKESTKLHTSQPAPSTSQPAASTSQPTATTKQQAVKIKILESEVLKLRKGMGTFVQGEEGLKYMMKSIKVPLDKDGVGHNFNKKANALKYEGRRGKPYKYAMPWKKCAKCGGQGHLAQNCRVRPQRQYFQKRSEGKTAYWNKKTAY